MFCIEIRGIVYFIGSFFCVENKINIFISAEVVIRAEVDFFFFCYLIDIELGFV